MARCDGRMAEGGDRGCSRSNGYEWSRETERGSLEKEGFAAVISPILGT